MTRDFDIPLARASDMIGEVQKNGSIAIVKHRSGLMPQKVSFSEFSAMNNGCLVQSGRYLYGSQGAVSGRIKSSVPNITNIAKEFSDDYHWYRCKKIQKRIKFELCDTCEDRFRCWTAEYLHTTPVIMSSQGIQINTDKRV